MKSRLGVFRGSLLFRVILFALLLLVIPAFWSLSPQPSRADGGGGFPTSTFVFVFPTSTSILFFPTATLFPTVILPNDNSQAVVPATETPTAMVAPTPATPARRPTLAYLCWPMGLALIVVAVIGATFVFRRVLT